MVGYFPSRHSGSQLRGAILACCWSISQPCAKPAGPSSSPFGSHVAWCCLGSCEHIRLSQAQIQCLTSPSRAGTDLFWDIAEVPVNISITVTPELLHVYAEVNPIVFKYVVERECPPIPRWWWQCQIPRSLYPDLCAPLRDEVGTPPMWPWPPLWDHLL